MTTTRKDAVSFSIEEGNNPLHLAVASGQEEIVKTILDNINDPQSYLERENQQEQTPINIAKQENNESMITLLNRYLQNSLSLSP